MLECALMIEGSISSADHTTITLKITAETASGVNPKGLVDLLLDESIATSTVDKLRPPSTITYPHDSFNPFSAEVSIQKSSSGWRISDVMVALLWKDIAWRPLDEYDVILRELGFFLNIVSKDGTTINAATSVVYNTSGSIGATLDLAGTTLSAKIAFDSISKLLAVECSIEDKAYITLRDVALDDLLHAPGAEQGNDIQLVAYRSPAPASSPLGLAWCAAPMWGEIRKCSLTFDDTLLKRVSLSADYSSGNWQLSSQLSLTSQHLF